MGQKKIGTKFPGVRARRHPSRKHGVRYDECYFIRHRVDGKLVEEQVGWLSQGKTAESAYLLLSELKDNARKGLPPRTLREMRSLNEQTAREEQSRSISFEDYFSNQYLPEAKKRKAEKTIRVEEGHLRDWLAPIFQSKAMRDISGHDLERVKDTLFAAGRSPRTIQHCLAIFRLVWNHARKRGVVTIDCPTGNINMPRVNNARSRFLTADEASRLLEEIKTLDKDAWELTLAALYTGARLGELTSLSWAGVDLKDSSLRLLHTKTGEPRTIPLATPLSKALIKKTQGPPEAFVFTNRDGKPWKECPWAFRKAVEKLALNEGRADRRDRIVFHSLRHTSASMMLSAGVDIKSLQSIFGWSTLQMAGRYTHAINEAKVGAIEKLEQAFKRKEGNVIPLQKRGTPK